MNFIDLFCGAGGLSKGFEMAGFKCIYSIDSSPACIETHKLNFPDCESICTDIMNINPKDVKKKIKKDINFIVGGPPCPTFSTIGHAKIRSINKNKNKNFKILDDDRNFLFRKYFEFVKVIKPDFFIMENVPNFITKYKGAIFNETVKLINDIGYEIINKNNLIYNSADYGVPQKRKRMILIGSKKKKIKFQNPEITHTESNDLFSKKLKNYVTVEQAINDLPKITDNWRISECEYSKFNNLSEFQKNMRKKNKKTVKNNICRMTNDRAKKVFSYMKQGDKYMDLPKKVRNILPFREDIFHDRLKRLVNNKPSWTVIAHIGMDGYMYIHPTELRTLSVREAARIQSFPDNFEFSGNQMETYHQVGNAVPVLLAKALALALKKTIKEIDKN